eukprot:TRINITY_DN29469_c0_g1_i3.p1 TRINITY_DN29469_c0_g1~~TRINITY_DN29469_c0_g1_i3.p1  ORF type:complete len:261 (+),score=40.62 TRINITY_DN29469_c0_g1_i3:143-925(+)
MIEAFYIFTTGGPVLWSIQLTKITGDPVNALIRQVLVDEDEGRKDAIWVEPYYMRWRLLRQAELCFVVAYQGLMQRAYLERVLEGMIERFMAADCCKFAVERLRSPTFDCDFHTILEESRRPAEMRAFADTPKGKIAQNKRAQGQFQPSVDEARRRRVAREFRRHVYVERSLSPGENGRRGIPMELLSAADSLTSPTLRTAACDVLRDMRNHIREPLEARNKLFKDFQLAWHPDKNSEAEQAATAIFQLLQAAKPWFLAS